MTGRLRFLEAGLHSQAVRRYRVVFCAILLVVPLLSRVFAMLPLMPGAYTQLHPAIAYRDSVYLAVWEEWRNSEASDIYGARIDFANQLLDSVGLPISTAGRNQADPAIAATDSLFFVAWDDCRDHGFDIYGTRVTTRGVVLDPGGIAIRLSENTAMYPAIAAGQSNLLVVWQETPPDSESYVAAARVSFSGVLLDTAPIRVSRAPGWQARPRVACSTTDEYYAVVWEARSDRDDSSLVMVARVSSSGALLDSMPVRACTTASRQTAPDVAWAIVPQTGWRGFMVVWEDDRSDSLTIMHSGFDSLFRILVPWGRWLHVSNYSQHHPRVAQDHFEPYSNLNFFICWNQRGDYSSRREVYTAELPSPGGMGTGNGVGDANADLCCPVYANDSRAPENFNGVLVTTAVLDSLSVQARTARAQLFMSGVTESSAPRPALGLMVEPNKVSSRAIISWESNGPQSAEVRVFDLLGRERGHETYSCVRPGLQRVTLNVDYLPVGVYFVQLRRGRISATGRLDVLR